MYWVLAIAVVLGLTAAVSAVVFYAMFLRTTEGMWRGEVLRRRDAALRLRDDLICGLEAAPRQEEADALALTGQAFQKHLHSIPVSALAEYPGIGPFIVERLQAQGYCWVDGLYGARLEIPGLSPERIADLDLALRRLTESAHRQIDSGACPEALALAIKLDALRRRRLARESEARAQLLQVDAFLAAIQPAAEAAEAMSFWNYVYEQFFVGGESEYQSIVETPVPRLEQFFRDEQPARIAVLAEAPIPTPQASTAIREAH